jgi:hypothetical protein
MTIEAIKPATAGNPNMKNFSANAVTFAVQHPNMSHALLMDGTANHSEQFIRNWAVRHILVKHNVLLPADEFVVQIVEDDTETDFSIL